MTSLHLALYQPEIAANLGAAIRNAACLGAQLHVIEPCGFPWKAQDISRVALDYGNIVKPQRHASWEKFSTKPFSTKTMATNSRGRLILMTTKATSSLYDISFAPNDVILIGQESAGVPDAVHEAVDFRVKIPLAPTARSINMATSAAIALAEARRQIGWPQ